MFIPFCGTIKKGCGFLDVSLKYRSRVAPSYTLYLSGRAGILSSLFSLSDFSGVSRHLVVCQMLAGGKIFPPFTLLQPLEFPLIRTCSYNLHFGKKPFKIDCKIEQDNYFLIITQQFVQEMHVTAGYVLQSTV